MPDDPEPDEPTGHAAIAHVAASKTPGAQATANALAFFMGDEPPPGRDERIHLEVDFGKPDAPDLRTCVFRPLSNEQFVAAAVAARLPDKDAIDGTRIDPFLNWSFAFAYACVDPDLTAVLAARRERADVAIDGQPFTDTASLVRDIFRYRSGSLRAVMDALERESRMQEDGAKLVRQIEAGKG